MYGLIGRILAVPGERDRLAVLLAGIGEMPGCRSYVVALDPASDDGIWVTEVWDSSAAHRDSLALPAVREAVEQGRPLIAGFAERFETEPVAGYGLG